MAGAMDLTPQEEAALVEALRANHDAAYEEVVRRYGPALLAVARRLVRHEQDAQDAVRDGFLAAFRALPAFRGESRLSIWLQRILIGAALMQIRQRQPHPEALIEPFLPTFGEDGLQTVACYAWNASKAVLDIRETRTAVRTAVDRLPHPYRTVLVCVTSKNWRPTRWRR
jgi:RNA polymerase sigma-70 factor, ECF subfamily